MFRFYVRILCSDFFTTCSDFMFRFYVRILCSDFMSGFYVRILCSDFFTTCSDFMFGFYVQSLCSYFMFCSEFSGFMFRSLAGMTRILAVYPILQGVAWFSSPPAPSKSPPLKRQGMGAPDWVYVLHLLAMSAGRGLHPLH